MSEYLYKPGGNARLIFNFTEKLIHGKVSKKDVLDIQSELQKALPQDFISAVDELVKSRSVDITLKKGINKMLNVFYLQLNQLPETKIKSGSFLDYLVKDNAEIDKTTKQFRKQIKGLQIKTGFDETTLNDLKIQIDNFQRADQHYQIVENILFPFLESKWPDHKCFQVLWSVHDDARNEIRELQKLLYPGKWDLKRFNKLIGDLLFNLNTIIFREEKILLPAIVEAKLSEQLDEHLNEAHEMGWSFIQVEKDYRAKRTEKSSAEILGSEVKFATGKLMTQQIELIFNHLPVDITFVDETDTVRYFSTPKKRTFPRTPAVIGRKVQNCHPPESVWMVEEILEAFKKGEQDDASFWIPFKNQFVYIQYFAVRDAEGKYCGTIEVTQDVKEIRELKGERRLLNWEAKSNQLPTNKKPQT